ncbi:hypothetical protein M885DRAFT_504210 [Pelagophyceae sp. CCMP2097]|nr:hypothetical protein M885DRAFT_504210 [Pelagophyceae sp. CCMP2097]
MSRHGNGNGEKANAQTWPRSRDSNRRGGGGGGGGGSRRGMPASEHDTGNEWTCSICDVLNFPQRETCRGANGQCPGRRRALPPARAVAAPAPVPPPAARPAAQPDPAQPAVAVWGPAAALARDAAAAPAAPRRADGPPPGLLADEDAAMTSSLLTAEVEDARRELPKQKAAIAEVQQEKATLERMLTKHMTASSEKDAEIASLHTVQLAVFAEKDAEISSLRRDLDRVRSGAPDDGHSAQLRRQLDEARSQNYALQVQCDEFKMNWNEAEDVAEKFIAEIAELKQFRAAPADAEVLQLRQENDNLKSEVQIAFLNKADTEELLRRTEKELRDVKEGIMDELAEMNRTHEAELGQLEAQLSTAHVRLDEFCARELTEIEYPARPAHMAPPQPFPAHIAANYNVVTPQGNYAQAPQSLFSSSPLQGYGGPPQGYRGSPQVAYGGSAPQGAYGGAAPPGAYGAPQGSYGAPPMGYGAPPPTSYAPAPAPAPKAAGAWGSDHPPPAPIVSAQHASERRPSGKEYTDKTGMLESRVLMVNLPSDGIEGEAKKDELALFFSRYGAVVEIKVVKGNGYWTVLLQMDTLTHAVDAVRAFDAGDRAFDAGEMKGKKFRLGFSKFKTIADGNFKTMADGNFGARATTTGNSESNRSKKRREEAEKLGRKS